MTNRVLLTGAGGFIGRHVLRYLVEHTDWQVYSILTREISFDLGYDPLPDREFDWIINLASDANLGRSIEQPRATIENNVMLMVNLLEYARAQSGVRFLHLTTDEANDVRNPYGASKHCQEAIAQAYRTTYDMPIAMLRADIVVGAGQPADKVVPKLIAAIAAGESIPVMVHGVMGMESSRTYTTVGNVADALRFMVDRNGPGIFHVGGQELVVTELASRIAGLLDVEVPGYQSIPAPNTLRSRSSNINPLLADVGWSPPETLTDELQRMLP